MISAFCDEARFLSTLEHPNIIRMIGVCVCPPTLCIVLELCDRGNLMEYIAACGNELPLVEQLELGIDCCRAVAFLHSRPLPVVHGDIKRFISFSVNTY